MSNRGTLGQPLGAKPLTTALNGDNTKYLDGTGVFSTPVSAGGFSGARVFNSTRISVPNNTAWVTLTFDSERFDTHGFHDTSTNNSRFTIPAGMDGYYDVGGAITWCIVGGGGSNSSGDRHLTIWVNGTVITWYVEGSGVEIQKQINAIVKLSAGDYVEFLVYQNSGVDLEANISGSPHGYSTEFYIAFKGA